MKLIKFDLPIDGIRVKNIDELREHFTIEIVAHFHSGLLKKWLRSRKNNNELIEISSIENLEEHALLKRLCEIFNVEADDIVITAMLDDLPEKSNKNSADIAKLFDEVVNALDVAAYHALRNTCISIPEQGEFKWSEKPVSGRGELLLTSGSSSIFSPGRGDIKKILPYNGVRPKGKIAGWFLLSPNMEDYAKDSIDFLYIMAMRINTLIFVLNSTSIKLFDTALRCRIDLLKDMLQTFIDLEGKPEAIILESLRSLPSEQKILIFSDDSDIYKNIS